MHGNFHRSVIIKTLVIGETSIVHADIKAGEVQIYDSRSGDEGQNKFTSFQRAGLAASYVLPYSLSTPAGCSTGDQMSSDKDKQEQRLEQQEGAGQERSA